MATWFIAGLPPGLDLFAYYLRESGGTIQIRNTSTNAWVSLSTNPTATDVDTDVNEVGTNTGVYSWSDPSGVDGLNEEVEVVLADKSVTTSLNPEVSTIYANGPLVTFARPYNILLRATIFNVDSQTSFVLAQGSSDDDAYNGCIVVVQDVSNSSQKGVAYVTDYAGATKILTISSAMPFTVVNNDQITILADRSLKPGTDNRTLLVESDGMAHADIKEAAGVVWTAGAITALVVADNFLTSSKIAANAIGENKIADGAFTSLKFAAAALNRIADHILRRQQANVEASSDGDALLLASLHGAIQQMQESNLTATPGKQTVYKTDGTTVLGTRDVTSNAAAEPITGIS